MVKRIWEEGEDSLLLPKKRRLSTYSKLSTLSDELVLKILSFLPIPSLASCQRVSRSFQSLACDSQIWKERYYDHWVRPRALRIPGIKAAESSSHTLQYSSKLVKWLDDVHLLAPGRQTDWYRQYLLRINWLKGRYRTHRVEIGNRDMYRMLSQVYGGFIFTAHAVQGIRVWATKEGPSVIASMPINPPKGQGPHSPGGGQRKMSCPQSLGIDPLPSGAVNLVVGFDCGSFRVYKFSDSALTLEYDGKHGTGSYNAIAMLGSFILVLSFLPESPGELHLLRFPTDCHQPAQLPDPKPLMSLSGCRAWTPKSISLRSVAGCLVAAVAYFCDSVSGEVLAGIQEVRMTEDGEALDSRLALSNTPSSVRVVHGVPTLQPSDSFHQVTSRPAFVKDQDSIIYSHPYLLARLSDNTMMAYLVTSTPDEFEIGPGQRLWGHTSCVTNIRLNGRGKAVSSTHCGEDIRVWDLERILSSSCKIARPSLCVRIPSYNPISCDFKQLTFRDRMSFCEWIGFDNEQIFTLCVDIDDYYHEQMLKFHNLNSAEKRSWTKIHGAKHNSKAFWSCYDFT